MKDLLRYLSNLEVWFNNKDDDEFRFYDTSTHEGHLRYNGVLTLFQNTDSNQAVNPTNLIILCPLLVHSTVYPDFVIEMVITFSLYRCTGTVKGHFRIYGDDLTRFDIFPTYFAILNKEDNFCDVLFAFQHDIKPILGREQILSF